MKNKIVIIEYIVLSIWINKKINIYTHILIKNGPVFNY